MTVAFAVRNTTTFAAAGWSDETGFAASAQLVVDQPVGNVVNGLDQSASEIDYLEITEGASGTIGGNGAGLVMATGSSESGKYARNRSAVRLYLAAAATKAIHNFDFGGRSTNNLVSGTIKTVTGDGGELFVAEAVVIDTALYLFGGTSDIADNATPIPDVILGLGKHTLRRGATTVVVTQGAQIVIDCEDRTITNLIDYGGKLTFISGIVTNYKKLGGPPPDLSRVRRASTLGGTLLQSVVPIPGHHLVTSAARTTPGMLAQVPYAPNGSLGSLLNQ